MAKLAQISVEFMMLLSISFLIAIIFSAVGFNYLSDSYKQTEFDQLKHITQLAQNEILLAYNLEDGYERTFTLPNQISNNPYTINIQNNKIISRSKNFELWLRIPEIEGNLNTGINTISKNETIKIN